MNSAMRKHISYLYREDVLELMKLQSFMYDMFTEQEINSQRQLANVIRNSTGARQYSDARFRVKISEILAHRYLQLASILCLLDI